MNHYVIMSLKIYSKQSRFILIIYAVILKWLLLHHPLTYYRTYKYNFVYKKIHFF